MGKNPDYNMPKNYLSKDDSVVLVRNEICYSNLREDVFQILYLELVSSNIYFVSYKCECFLGSVNHKAYI